MTVHIDVTLADKRKEVEAYFGSLEQEQEQARRIAQSRCNHSNNFSEVNKHNFRHHR